MYDLVLHNARIASAGPGGETATTLAVSEGRIAALDVPADAPARERLDAAGQLVLPGFIDCHTHALYAGDRMAEHSMKLEGASYEDIARAGGGIISTVNALRRASVDILVAQTLPRLRALLAEGVTTVEIKSGYGLAPEHELKMLEAIARLRKELPLRIVPTFLGAHAVPPGTTREAYLDEVVEVMLPAVAEAGLADTVDIFVERIAFDTADEQRLFARARELGFKLRAHTDQLSNMGATRLAAEAGALSCDHLEYIEADDIAAMAANGTVAVLLPGAFYFLRETRKPPVAALRGAGVPMAVATDLNPGSSPVASLLTAMHMATLFFGLTPYEALAGVTRNAARALGRGDTIGALEPGLAADFSLWDIPAADFLVYQLGGVRPSAVYIEGKKV